MKIGYRYSLPLFLLLAPFPYAMFFTFPFGDDFVRAVVAHGLFDWVGGLMDVGLHWLRWSGRYTHHFLVVFLGDAVLSRAGYGAVCLGVFALYGIALFAMFRRIAAGARPQELAFFTLASLLALAAGHQSLNITYYLVTDALGLGIGNAMVLMFIFTLARLWHLPAMRRRDAAYPIFCAAFAIGCYEHAAIATVLSAALALWMARQTGHPHRRAFLLIAGASLAFLLASFLAPGNFNRQQIRAVTWDRIAEQLLLAGTDWLAIAWQASHSHFVLLGLFLGLAITPRVRSGLRPIPPGRMAAAGLAVFVALSAGIVLVHALSDVRVVSIHKLPASISLLSGVALTYISLSCAGALRAHANRIPVLFLVAPVILLFAASTNTWTTIRSILTGQLDAYAATMTTRLAVLGASQGGDVRLAPLPACPFPACVGEPVPASSATWPAAYIARLFGQRSVVTAAPDAARAYALFHAVPSPQWTRISGAEIEAAYAVVEPGPNASYRDGWIFLRAARPLSAPAVNVLTAPRDPWGYLPAGFESAQRSGLFGDPSFALDARHGFFGNQRKLRLAAIEPAVHGAAIGLADPSNVSAVFVSLDGVIYHRLPISRQ
jgi:hypothetical protein